MSFFSASVGIVPVKSGVSANTYTEKDKIIVKIKSSETAEETNFLCFLCCFNFMSYYPFCMLLYNSSNHLYKQVYILLPSSHPVNWDIKTYKLIFCINMRASLYAGTPACPFLIIFNDNDVLYWKQNVFSILLKFFQLKFFLTSAFSPNRINFSYSDFASFNHLKRPAAKYKCLVFHSYIGQILFLSSVRSVFLK